MSVSAPSWCADAAPAARGQWRRDQCNAAIVFLQVLLVGLALAEEPDAPSTNWSAVSSADNVVQYIDFSTVQVLGAKRKAWVLWNFRTPQSTSIGEGAELPMYVKYRSELNYQLFDCDERTLGDLQFSLHPFWNGNGPVLITITRDLGEVHLTASPPGSMGDFARKAVCSLELVKPYSPKTPNVFDQFDKPSAGQRPRKLT